MNAERIIKRLRRHGKAGTYVVKAAESPTAKVQPRTPPPGYLERTPDPEDGALARQLLARKRGKG